MARKPRRPGPARDYWWYDDGHGGGHWVYKGHPKPPKPATRRRSGRGRGHPIDTGGPIPNTPPPVDTRNIKPGPGPLDDGQIFGPPPGFGPPKPLPAPPPGPEPAGDSGVSATTAAPATIGRLTVLLDNRDGSLTAPRLFSIFTLTRGLIVAGVSYGQSAGAWYVTGFRYLLADGLLEISATDALGLLSSWSADTSYTYRGATVAQLVERVCALAGVHTVAFDATASWSDVVAGYTHPIGQNALYSLRSLVERVPFEYLAREDGSLYFFVPTASPAAVYTFGPGAGEHNAWITAGPGGANWSFAAPPWFGADESVTYLQAIGAPPRNRVAEAIDQAMLNDTGRRRSLLINDRRLTTDAMATADAGALLVAAQERRRSGVFDTPPSFALEPGDVVAINSGGYAQSNGPWRVERFEEHFNLGSAQPFAQRVMLRGTA